MAWELALAVDVTMPVRYTAKLRCVGPTISAITGRLAAVFQGKAVSSRCSSAGSFTNTTMQFLAMQDRNDLNTSSSAAAVAWSSL